MAEPTISLSYPDLASKVGDFLGWGRGAVYSETAWNAHQIAIIDDCIRSGYRKFLSPSPAYDWSFLHPFTDPGITLPANDSSVPLPDDCAGIEGDITITSTPGSMWPVVRLTNPGRIKALFAAAPDTTGQPLLAAIEQIKGVTEYAGQRQKLIVYPTADQSYTLTFQYYVVPNAPTATDPFLYGGPVHSETILEACLCVAEQRQDDMTGLHTQLFQERLSASMGVDRRSKGQYLGRNRDTSDDIYADREVQTMTATYTNLAGVTVNAG